MWFEHPVPTPERIPEVPMRLGLLVRRYLPGATRIDVHVRAGTGWRKVNALHFEEGDGSVDPGTISAMVKACADHHAMEANAGGKYRGMIWRHAEGELDHKKARFDVELESTAKRRPPPPRRTRRSLQRTAIETRAMLEEIVAMSSAPGLDRMTTLRRAIESPLDRVRRELSDMAELYEVGSSTGTADGLALAELRIREKLAGLRGQEDADVWSAIAPMVEAGLARLRVNTTAAAVTAGNGQRRADDPDAERNEGAPPSSGDAPSPGKEAADS